MAKKAIRNVGIIAHIDAGKTTVSERILYYSHKEHRLGEVDAGTATMDWMAEEQRRGITITSASTSVEWRDHRLNLVDTPGHVDFTSEVERCLRVLDGAVGVFCGCAGVQAQSETVWRQADRYGVPRLAFVNKLDRVGSDFFRVVESIRRRLNARPVALQVPMGREKTFEGVVDLLRERALRFDPDSLGATVEEGQVPGELEGLVASWREKLLEAAVDCDESLLEPYLDGEEIPEARIRAALRKGTLERQLTPVYAGAALRNIGVQPLLDGICDFLPSPQDCGPVRGSHPDIGEPVELGGGETDPLCALAFKTVADPHADLVYVRIYSGVLHAGRYVMNGRTRRKDRPSGLFLMHANHRERLGSAPAGDIVAVVGFRDTVTGDTLYEAKAPILMEPPQFPQTVVAMAVEPVSTTDRPKLLELLDKIAREDPTIRWREDPDTGQIVVSGMGELHLEVLRHRLAEDFHVDVNVGTPRVSYRQTIVERGEGEGVFERQVGDKLQYARLVVAVEPAPDRVTGEVADELGKEAVPLAFHPTILESLKAELDSGGDLGLPLTQVRVRVLDGTFRPEASTQVAFSAAASAAFDRAMAGARSVVLEPLMRFELQFPDEYYGAVSTDLAQRRSTIDSVDLEGGIRTVRGTVPLAEVFGYSNALRALTQGRGTLSLEPETYRPVPPEVARRFRSG